LFDLGWWSFPSLYSYITSWPLRLFGVTVFGLRLPSALIGTLAVAVTFAFASKSFGKTVGLASALFLAVSGFHIHFSRLGLNNVWESLFSALLALTLAAAWESRDRFRFVLPGLVLGLMQFFYFGGRVFLLLVPLWILLAASGEARPRQARLTRIGIALWAAGAAVLPLALYYLQHPDGFFEPWRRVSLFWYWWDIQTVMYGDPWWWILGDQLSKAALGFVSTGLTEFYGGPLLTPIAAVLFLLGSVRLLRNRREANVLWLGLWIVGTMATVSLSANPPAAQRYIGAAPAVAVVVALGAEDIVRLVSFARATTYRLRISLIGGLLLVAAAWELRHYFIAPSAAQAFGEFHVGTAARAAEALAGEEEGYAAFFFIVPPMRLAQDDSVRFLAPTLTAQDVPDTEDWQITLEASRESSLFFLPGREDDLAAVRGCLPQGEVSQVEGPGDELLFLRYKVHPDRSVVCGAHAGAADGDGP
jgi:4-amino-4-deoxy-L-arabinose transferase-like glycosyltransferase